MQGDAVGVGMRWARGEELVVLGVGDQARRLVAPDLVFLSPGEGLEVAREGVVFVAADGGR